MHATLTNAELDELVTYIFTEEIRHEPAVSTAPNGSSRGTDYHRTVVHCKVWANDPRAGIYAGKTYELRQHYISSSPDTRGQCIGSEQKPWSVEF